MEANRIAMTPDFAELLRTFRKTAGLSQPGLAKRAALSVAAIRDLEQGRRQRRRPESVRRLTAALGLSAPEAEAMRYAAGAVPAARTPSGRAQSGDPPALWLQVLGPMTAWHGQTEVDLGQPRQRAALAWLALEPGRLTHRETLIDSLWGEAPPSTAVNVLQGYLSRLRQALEPGRSPRDPLVS